MSEKEVKISSRAIYRANKKPAPKKFAPPKLFPGVVPEGRKAAIAMDDISFNYANHYFDTNFQTFPGYPYLASLTTRAEFRQISTTIANELTRGWISIESRADDDVEANKRISELNDAIEQFNLKQVVNDAALNEGFFGRGQIFVNIKNHDKHLPLVISDKTIEKGSLINFKSIEPMWTTPSAYNALTPEDKDFYKPKSWFLLGRETHASRLLTIVTRPLPDMLKPAYNFSGMSLSQMAEAYVDNWLRTRQAVSDLINNFSITALATDMSQTLMGGSGAEIDTRADLFTAFRSNRGLMLLDKEREELVQVNTPLSGLHELQAQALEHICSVTRIPAMIYTGISPSGLNASSEGEVRVFYDWIISQLESHYRKPIQKMLEILQLHLWGTIDPNIEFNFNPLWEMDEKELSNIRKMDADTAAIYIDRGVLDPEEVREKLAHDIDSGYQGIDLTKVIEDPRENDQFGLLGSMSDQPVQMTKNKEEQYDGHGESKHTDEMK